MAETEGFEHSDRVLNKRSLYIALAIFLVCTQAMIFVVGQLAWFDVSFSLETVQKLRVDGLSSIDFSQYDAHPPTYYYALYVWSYLNPGLTEYHWAQELSVLFGLIFFTFVWLALTELFGHNGSLATMLLSACSSFIHYGVEARSYMLLLMLSAIILYCIVMRLRGTFMWVAAICAFLLPMTHYLASMAVIFFTAMVVLVSKSRNSWSLDRVGIMVFMIAGMAGMALSAFMYALPQHARVEGTWFLPSSITSWPSSLMFTMFFTENLSIHVATFVLIMSIILYLFWKLFRLVKPYMNWVDLVWVLMIATALAPLSYLAIANLLRSMNFSNLYHHRFFLVITWMFAAAAFVALAKWLDSLANRKLAVSFLLCVFAGLIAGSVVASQNVPRELQILIEQTPCEAITIVHESPFSAIPYQYYAREKNCAWDNIILTNLTQRMLNGGGGDIVSDKLFYNLTLPANVTNYYYVNGSGLVSINGSVTVIVQEDGVNLLRVRSS